MSDSRPTWDKIWSDFAQLISQRSYDPRLKVGAVIVTSDNTQVLSVGYNGNHSGGPNVVDSISPGESGFIHAENNALIKLDYNHHKPRKMYLTDSPCSNCAKLILNAGIAEVYYINEYRDTTGLDLLRSFGVSVARIYDSTEK